MTRWGSLKSTRELTGGALMLAALAGGPALAQSAAGPGVEQVALADTVTVYGTRNPSPTLTYPGMVDVLDQGDIDTQIPSTVSDLVKDMPNVQFAGGPRRTGESPVVRGLGGQDVLVLVDGVRQSWTSGHDGRFFLDPALLASAEVVRGPNSALYGSGALGGVIAFRTANASDFLKRNETIGARVAFGYQGVDGEFLRTLTGFTHRGGFDLIGSIGQRSAGDISLGSGANLAADDDIVTGFAKAGYSIGDGFSAQVSYQGFKNDAVEPDDGQGLTTGAPVDKTITSGQIAGEIRWKPAQAGFINLHLTPYRLEGEVTEVDPSTGEQTSREITTNGFSIDNRTPFGAGGFTGLLTVGGEWYEDDQKGRDSASATGTRSGVPDGTDEFWGAFAQAELHAHRPLGAPGVLTLIPAVRYDSYNTSSAGNPDTSKSKTSPKFAATYEPVKWFFVFGNVGEAFRAPGINELYLRGVHFSVPHPILPGVSVANSFVPNPNLEPESSFYWETGAGLNFSGVLTEGDRLLVKSSYWSQRVDDYINLSVMTPASFYSPGCFTPPTFLADCNVGTTTAVNVDADLHGTEVETSYDNRRVHLELNYGDVTGKERGTSYDLTTLMPELVTVIGTFKLPEVDASVSLRARFAGSLDKSYNPATSDPSSESRDGYTVVDLYATWAPGDGIFGGAMDGLRVDAGIDNVAGEDYEPYQAGVSAPGRNPKLLVSYTRGW